MHALKKRNKQLYSQNQKADEDKKATYNEKNNILKRLRAEAICPVCLLVPRAGKIPVHRNGHITCLKC